MIIFAENVESKLKDNFLEGLKMDKKRVILLLVLFTAIAGFTLGNVSAVNAKIVNKKVTIDDYEIDYFYSKYIGINKGKTYKNGAVSGRNPMNNRIQKAPVYAHKTKIAAKKGVRINKVIVSSIGYPSGKTYRSTYYFSKSKVLAPGKYKGFWKYTIYFQVKK